MIRLNPGCSDPRAPVAECFLSVLLCVGYVLVSGPGLRCSLRCRIRRLSRSGKYSTCPHFLYCTVLYYKRESVCVFLFFSRMKDVPDCSAVPAEFLQPSNRFSWLCSCLAVRNVCADPPPPVYFPIYSEWLRVRWRRSRRRVHTCDRVQRGGSKGS